MKKLFFVSLLVLSIVACKKDPSEPEPQPEPAPTTGSMKVELEPAVGDSDLVYGTKWYKNFNNDSFQIDICRYYISNVVLTKSDNSSFVVANSYYKIDHAIAERNIFTMSNIPVGNYKSIQFVMGVDSTRNVSGAQDGDLATSDMFWSWSTGYIFAKLEGKSPKSTAPGQFLTFHIGGFKVPNSSLRTVTIGFGSSTANVTSSSTPQVHLKSDIAKWFYGPGGTINFAVINSIMSPGTNAKKIADNYAQSISFEHVHN